MGNALRAAIATALLGLTLAPAASADTSTTDFYIARDACGGSDPQNLRLDLEPGAFSSSCGNLAAILGGATDAYPAANGLPITIDGTRPTLVSVGTESFTGPPLGGIGDQTITVELLGRTPTKTRIPLGKDSQTVAAPDMLRNGGYVAEFQLPAPSGTYTGLTLNLTVGGSEMQGYVQYDGNSFVSVPVPDPVP